MQPPAPTPPFTTKHLVVLGVLEGVVMSSLALRTVLAPATVNLARTSHLAWFVGTVLLASSAVALFVVASMPLARRAQAGDDVTEARRQVLITAVAVIVGALLLSLAGPGVIAQALGEAAQVP